MTEFSGFTESAKLFAENAEIVRAMQEGFEREEGQFLSAIEQRVRDRLGDRPSGSLFQVKPTSGIYRTWWLGDEAESFKPYPRMFVRTGMPEVVLPGKLVVYVQSGNFASKDFSASIANLKNDPNLLAMTDCAKSPDPYALFVMEIDTNRADPVETAAAPITWMAEALFAKYQEWKKQQPSAAG